FQKEAKSLLEKGYRVTIVTPRKDGYLFDIDGSLFKDKFLKDKFKHEGIKIVTYDPKIGNEKFKNWFHNISMKKTDSFSDPLFKIGLKQKADIYHAHEFGSLYSGVGIKRVLKKKGKKVKL